MAGGGDKLRSERQVRYRRGHVAEIFAAGLLLSKGYIVLARRFQTPAGEIDLVVRRGRRLAFIEVKRRPTFTECESSVTTKQRQRIRSAADYWLARHPSHRDHDICFDVIFLVPRHWPRHLADSL